MCTEPLILLVVQRAGYGEIGADLSISIEP